MKRIIKSILMLMIAFTILTPNVSALAATTNTEKAYMKKYDKILQTMKKDMKCAPKTGDVTLDFLYDMVPHHEAAVEMAKNILKYTENEEIKKMSDSIIKEQSKEIKMMKDLIKCLKEKPQEDKVKEAEYLKVYDCILKKMIEGMEKAKVATGCIDKDFLDQMIVHHEGAVAMAKNVLNFTTNKEVREMAENIVKSQDTQVKQMKDLLKEYK